MPQHTWVPSRLGHGDMMCSRCFATNLEAAALGILNDCDAPEPKPAASNDNAHAPQFTQEHLDNEMLRDEEDGPDPGEECGRWSNGRLTRSCSKAGSEECDFECPYRGSL